MMKKVQERRRSKLSEEEATERKRQYLREYAKKHRVERNAYHRQYRREQNALMKAKDKERYQRNKIIRGDWLDGDKKKQQRKVLEKVREKTNLKFRSYEEYRIWLSTVQLHMRGNCAKLKIAI